MPRSGKRRWSAFGFRADRVLAGDRPPRYGMRGCLRFTVGRGPVPRHASVEETALASVRFSSRACARGGQAPALRARAGFASPGAVREQVLPNYGFLKVRKTLMSIELKRCFFILHPSAISLARDRPSPYAEGEGCAWRGEGQVFPPRYGERRRSCYCSAGACPPRAFLLSESGFIGL